MKTTSIELNKGGGHQTQIQIYKLQKQIYNTYSGRARHEKLLPRSVDESLRGFLQSRKESPQSGKSAILSTEFLIEIHVTVVKEILSQ